MPDRASVLRVSSLIRSTLGGRACLATTAAAHLGIQMVAHLAMAFRLYDWYGPEKRPLEHGWEEPAEAPGMEVRSACRLGGEIWRKDVHHLR